MLRDKSCKLCYQTPHAHYCAKATWKAATHYHYRMMKMHLLGPFYKLKWFIRSWERTWEFWHYPSQIDLTGYPRIGYHRLAADFFWMWVRFKRYELRWNWERKWNY